MIISSSAIVLSKLKYRDNDLIVKLLVRELGVTSFIVRGAVSYTHLRAHETREDRVWRVVG